MNQEPRPVQSPQAPREHRPDLWHFLRVIWEGKWTMMTIFVFVLTGVIFATVMQTKIYRASVLIKVDPYDRHVLGLKSESSTGRATYWSQDKYYKTQFRVIRSKDLVEKMVAQLDPRKYPEMTRADDPVDFIISRTSPDLVPNTSLIKVSVDAENPEFAAEWANLLAETYVQNNMDTMKEQREEVHRSLQGILSPIEEKIKETESEIFRMSSETDATRSLDQKEVLDRRIDRLSIQIEEVRKDLLELDTILQQARINNPDVPLYTISLVADDPGTGVMLSEKVGLEQELLKLSETYGPRHRKIVDQRARLDAQEQKLLSHSREVLRRAEERRRIKAKTLTDLEADLARSQREIKQIERETGELVRTREDATKTEDIRSLVVQRAEEFRVLSSFLVNNVVIVERAQPTKRPVKPNWTINILFGIGAGLLLGMGVVFGQDYLDLSIRTIEDVEGDLGMRVLSVIPKFERNASHMARESFRVLRTSLIFASKRSPIQTLLVTSPQPGEGKSVIAANLAKVLAEFGERVLLIDCDLRKPTQYKLLKKSREHGMAEFLEANKLEEWRKYVKDSGVPNLSLITSGKTQSNPPDLFCRETFIDLIPQLKREFDWIIIDSPPVAFLSDGIILSALVDSVVFVVRHSKTWRDVVRRSLSNLRGASSTVVGCVINDVDMRKVYYRQYYYGKYYYGKYHYYQEEQPKPAQKKRRIFGNVF